MDKPFQTYDDTSDAATCAPRLKALRAELAQRGLDGFVVPHSDQHMGEYLPAYAERLAWLTAFTGSAGAAGFVPGQAGVLFRWRLPPPGEKPNGNQHFAAPGPVGARTPGRGSRQTF